MKLKKWLTASFVATSLLMGGMAVHADSLTLSGGEVLDLGSQVTVYDGQRSFFGSQIHDWLVEGNPEASIEKVLVEEKVFPENSSYAKEFALGAADILRHSKVYQVRAAANDTYYQGMVISLSVSDADGLKLALYQKEAMKNHTLPESEENPMTAAVLALCHGHVTVTSHSSWKDKTSEKGLPYQTGDAMISVERNGFTIPVYVKGLVMKETGRTNYTVLVADQVSGKYLAPFFDTALEGAK